MSSDRVPPRRAGRRFVFYARMASRAFAIVASCATAVVLLGVVVAPAAWSGPVTKEVNPQWSGYVVTAPHVAFTRITATWREPFVHCTRGDVAALSAAWVGLGGYASTVLEQVGVDANCDAAGKPSYYAWFELVPDTAHTVAETVAAGDTITGSVTRLKLNLVEVRIENRTRHWTFARQITWDASESSSAELIAEAPYGCIRFECSPAPLANFGSIMFHDITVVGDGRGGTLSTSAWRRVAISLVPCGASARSRAGAAPGAASADGGTFGINWVRNAGLSPACRKLPGEALGGGLPDVTEG